MRPHSILLLVLMGIGAPAFADENFNFLFQLRQDIEKNTTDVTSNNDTGNNIRLKANYLKFELRGKLAKDLKFKFQHTLNSNNVRYKDGIGSATDYAYLDKSYTNTLVRIGKQLFGATCGGAGNIDSLHSHFYSESCNMIPITLNGIAVFHTIKKQELGFAVINPDAKDLEDNNSDIGLSISYWGNLNSGMYKPIFNYSYFPYTEQRSLTNTVLKKKVAMTHFSIGSRLTLGKWWFEYDYQQTDSPDRTPGSSADREYQSHVISINYTPGPLYFEAKLESSQVTNGAIDLNLNEADDAGESGLRYDQFQGSLTAYYKPDPKTEMTYHLVYLQKNRDFTGTSNTVADIVDSKIMAGFSMIYSSLR